MRAAGRVQNAQRKSAISRSSSARGAKPLRVRDVAEVDIGKTVRTGAATYNGEEAVLGAALMLAGENSRLVAKRVAAKIKEIQNQASVRG